MAGFSLALYPFVWLGGFKQWKEHAEFNMPHLDNQRGQVLKNGFPIQSASQVHLAFPK